MKTPSQSIIAGSAALLANKPRVNQEVCAAVERRFELPGLTLAAREWGAPGGLPVIAIHGWLDNAGSFDLLAPQLTGTHLIAIDCAGHGYSEHRSADAAYNVWQDVPDVFAVADLLGWEQFALLGHSRGAGIASLAAGTMPERITALALIDGGIPVPGEPADAPQLFAKSVSKRNALRAAHGRIYPARDIAITQRSQGFTETTFAAAEILARRALREVAGGYSWFVDQRLKIESELRLSPEQIAAFMRAVKAPSLALLASQSPLTNRPGFVDLMSEISGIELIELQGGHHFHLEDAVTEIAQRVQAFFKVHIR